MTNYKSQENKALQGNNDPQNKIVPTSLRVLKKRRESERVSPDLQSVCRFTLQWTTTSVEL